MLQIRRTWRLVVLIGSFLAFTYFGLNQVQGELASWLVLIGSTAICHAWSRAWEAPQQ
jgi:hypothetical protein